MRRLTRHMVHQFACTASWQQAVRADENVVILQPAVHRVLEPMERLSASLL